MAWSPLPNNGSSMMNSDSQKPCSLNINQLSHNVVSGAQPQEYKLINESYGIIG